MIQGEGVKDFLWLNLWKNELSVFIFLYDQKLSIFPSTRHLQQNIKQENQHNYFNIKKNTTSLQNSFYILPTTINSVQFYKFISTPTHP